eukprot:759181-Pelagomonas_calceolata.AAC.4
MDFEVDAPISYVQGQANYQATEAQGKSTTESRIQAESKPRVHVYVDETADRTFQQQVITDILCNMKCLWKFPSSMALQFYHLPVTGLAWRGRPLAQHTR